MMKSALDIITEEIWCIEPGYLEKIIQIVKWHAENPDATRKWEGRDYSKFDVLGLQGYEPVPNARRLRAKEGVAVLPIIGPVFRYANLFTEISGATSLDQLSADFELAESSPDIDTIVLWSDSPGGQSTQIAEFASMIADSPKNTVGFAGDMAASAAYWILSATDAIVASPTAMLGSIGVVARFREKTGNGGGYREIPVYSQQSPKKELDLDSFSGRRDLQEMVDDMASVFVSHVARNRGTTNEDVLENFGQGGIMIASKAVNVGMADEVGSLKNALQVFNMSKDKSTRISSGNGLSANPPDYRATEMSASELRRINPDLYAEIFREGESSGIASLESKITELKAELDFAVKDKDSAATAERERIQSVLAESLPGHEELVDRLAFDGKTQPAQAALAILHAEREMRSHVATNLIAGRPDPAPSQESDGTSHLSDEERLKRKWDNDPALRAEFAHSYEIYAKYQDMKNTGRIKTNERLVG